jgi:hypothetical protein
MDLADPDLPPGIVLSQLREASDAMPRRIPRDGGAPYAAEGAPAAIASRDRRPVRCSQAPTTARSHSEQVAEIARIVAAAVDRYPITDDEPRSRR